VRSARRLLAALLVAVLAALGASAPAGAHVERPSYWPDPAADTSVTPAAGGKVPEARDLYTALTAAEPGDTRVVCAAPPPSAAKVVAARRALTAMRRDYRKRRSALRGSRRSALRTTFVRRQRTSKRAVRTAERRYAAAVAAHPSIARLRASLSAARTTGYRDRPSQPAVRVSAAEARRLLRFNERLLATCGFQEIQPAVTASGNNDRVVVMPGVYTEPTSRRQPKFDPRCKAYTGFSDYPQKLGAATYPYHWFCPNDANLVAVIGRRPGTKDAPNPPLVDRRGIPDLGGCVRCNLQLEGSGVSADDTVVEAGDPNAGNGGPSAVGHAKDVAVGVQRADGFVLRNLTTRHALEHGIYVIETDGYLLDRFKTLFNGEYGTLTFVADHGRQSNCEAKGHGDSGLYPGAPPETGEGRRPGERFRYNQELVDCDMHHNAAGYSSTNGNAVWIHRNKIYDNSLGLTMDVATSAGHPGFPDDSILIEDNDIFSNNFNVFAKGSDVKPKLPYPVGTGMWIAGGNAHEVRGNRFYDNHRRGVMLFAVPDVLVCGPTTRNVQEGCDTAKLSTSHRNRVHDNVMGVAPDGAKRPNGQDFWWDSFPATRENCWFGNAAGGGPIVSSPAVLPDCDGGRTPAASVGTGDVGNEGELVSCLVSFETRNFDPQQCVWFQDPGTPAPRAADREAAARARQAPYVGLFSSFCGARPDAPLCRRFEAGSSSR
jgi:hypothetical protein